MMLNANCYALRRRLQNRRKNDIVSAVYKVFGLIAKFRGDKSDKGDPDSFLRHYEITVKNISSIEDRRQIKFDYWGGLRSPYDLAEAFSNFMYESMSGAWSDTFEEYAADRRPCRLDDKELRKEFNENKRTYKKWQKLTDLDVFVEYENFKNPYNKIEFMQ